MTRKQLSQASFLLFTSVTLCLCGVHAFAQEDTKPTEWHVKGGLLKVSNDNILLEQKKSYSFPIKTASVTSVCYDTAVHGRGPSAWQATKEMGMGDARGLIFAPLVLPIVAGVHASKSTGHFITVHWKPEQPREDATLPSALTMEVGKKQYVALLQELQQATGKPWSDVSQRRKQLMSHISNAPKSVQRGKGGAFDLVVRRRSRVGNSILAPYTYAVVLQNSDSQTGDLYIFQGLKKDLELTAVVHVSVKDEKNSVTEVTPSYADSLEQSSAMGLPLTTVIRMPTRTLEISSKQPYDYDPECPVLP